MKYLVVKTGEEESTLARRLREEGNDVDELTVGRIVPLPVDVPDCDWVAVTSRHAAFAVAGRRVAAIGPRTAAAVEASGGNVAFRPSSPDSAAFLAEFRALLRPEDKVVRLKPKGTPDSLAGLSSVCRYTVLDAYENVPAPLPESVDLGRYDAAYFTSPSAVERLAPVASGRTECRAIGPVTEEALRSRGWLEAPRGRALFPMFVDLHGKSCLVVGAGRIARHKADMLASFGASVDIVAPEVNRPFSSDDVKGRALVVAATDDAEVNAAVARACRDSGVPVNSVDDAANCTFFFSSIARKGPVVAAMSSGGCCPAATQLLRDAVEPRLTDAFVAETERLGAMRGELKKRFPDAGRRREYCRGKLEESWKD